MVTCVASLRFSVISLKAHKSIRQNKKNCCNLSHKPKIIYFNFKLKKKTKDIISSVFIVFHANLSSYFRSICGKSDYKSCPCAKTCAHYLAQILSAKLPHCIRRFFTKFLRSNLKNRADGQTKLGVSGYVSILPIISYLLDSGVDVL